MKIQLSVEHSCRILLNNYMKSVLKRFICVPHVLRLYTVVNFLTSLAQDLSLIWPVAVQGDPLRLRQILNNLLGNAIKFTETGKVVVQVSVSGDDPAQQGGQASLLYRFEVLDTGIGVDAEVQSTIFESFNQGDGSTTRRYGGSGLGLAISKRLAAALGGLIGVESAPERGALFWFTARFARGKTEVRTGETDALRNKRVLIVDDDTDVRAVLERQCQAAGMVCYSVSGGTQVLDLLFLGPPVTQWNWLLVPRSMR